MTDRDRRALTSPANGRLSSGPRTPQGRAVSRFNAARHGILSRHLLLKDAVFPDESRKQLQRLHAQLRAELAPAGIVEEMLVERILVAYWRLRRVLIAEQGLIATNTIKNLEHQAMMQALFGQKTGDAPADPGDLQQELDALRHRHSKAAALLLGEDDVKRLTRYEVTLQRQLNDAIRDLLELQRLRLRPHPSPDTPAPPPVAIHVARVEVQPQLPATRPADEPEEH